MSRPIKILVLSGVSALVLGLIVGSIGFLMGGAKSMEFTRGGLHVVSEADMRDFVRIDESYETLSGIDIDAGSLEVIIKTGDGYAITAQNIKSFGNLTAELENGVLTVKSHENDHGGFKGFNWGINIGPWLQTAERRYIELTVPKDSMLDKVNVEADLSNVDISGLNAKQIEIDVDLSNIRLRDLTCETLNLRTNLGNVDAQDITADNATLRSDLGNFDLSDFHSKGLDVTTNLGAANIEGVLEGNSVIHCDTGAVHLTLFQPEKDTAWAIQTDLGSAIVNGVSQSGSAMHAVQGASNNLEITTNLGEVKLDFRG